ncbi:type cbb3 cytochrome oxidase biogenesis protein CcoG [Sulfuriferula multivorans]|uniref:Type cbb3 cytochrome oxidase biogenesis protein CcoG n=2 Tax=Sulfuriferula multivorans TaxID=1559896 RepID=A0A401JAP8_9PROT|nr:type cbb3 cytochrome oxidase biogenesis protein CcoG [Sulfuriferula multivorans]
MAEAGQKKVINIAASTEMEQTLYAVKQKVYPRAVSGWFASWRVALVLFTQLLYYGLPWLSWDGRQAILFDLAQRKFYILGLVFWPQDFIYLTGLLVIAAFSLFLFTAIAGRLWCGFACPQTVYTELFLWIERKIEGDRRKQMKLDRQAWNIEKIGKKTAKHSAWLVLALWTGFTFVGYFTPIKELAISFAHWTLGPWETFWIFFYGFATYGNAGFMREQVCKYMCPYARFQSVMFDSDTLTVTYDPSRGEPRGPRSKSTDRHTAGLGDCVDCSICVQVCPTDIDIRNGLQYECIGCAACIDGCDQVMAKMGYPRGLIRYTTENVIKGKYPDRSILAHVLRPRTLIYSVLLLAIVATLGMALINRVPLRVDAIRDRIAARETADGHIENVYRLQIINMQNKPHRYAISVTGLPGIKLGDASSLAEVAALGTHDAVVHVQIDPSEIRARSSPVEFKIQSLDNPELTKTVRSTFLNR